LALESKRRHEVARRHSSQSNLQSRTTLALAALFVRTVTADCTEGRHVPYSAMA